MDAKRYEQQFWDREYTEGCGFRERFYEEINELAWDDIFRTAWPLTGKTVAFIGCGTACGPVATMRRRGARVIAMDISPEAVRQVRDYPRYDGRGSMVPLVGDAERLPLANDSVDVVLGKAIVHHLDVRRFAREAARILRPGGRLIFWEPLGTNPIINLVRDLTPGLRVPTEHPLVPAHLKQLSDCFDDFRCEYHLCTSLIALPLFWLGLRRVPVRVLRRLDRIDQRWCRLSEPLRNLAWVVAISGRKPAAGQEPRPVFLTTTPAANHPEDGFGR
ncbi:MAG: class I SAM-dependent methyltransferase [Phycisphaerae bacterium]